jgi:hypothetical protein
MDMDKETINLNNLRELAKKYAEEALSDRGKAILKRYRDHNSRKIVRPPVLAFEVPWGEFDKTEPELKCEYAGTRYNGFEYGLRLALYQLKHFAGDYILHPYYRVGVALKSTGGGPSVKEKTINSGSGAYIVSHEFEDVIPNIEDIEQFKIPSYSINTEATENSLNFHREIFDGIMPVKKAGLSYYFAPWDTIPRLHGVENSMNDLYDRPEYVHALMEKMTQINEATMNAYEALNVLDTDPYYLHCTPAATYELPVKDMDTEKITNKDVWCRGMAQIFAIVSPEMHEEFDLQYMRRLFDRCGLTYYGCCEPLDTKVDILRQFKNLRRISITPWANPEVAAEKIGGDYIFSFKSNPAFVAGKTFDPEPVIAETERVIKACQKYGTPLEFIIKDISTVSNNPNNLSRWMETINSVIDRYY